MLRKVLVHFVIPLGILGVGAAAAVTMVRSAETTEPSDPERAIPLVEVIEAVPYDGPVHVSGNGVIEAEREATVSPQISGRILAVGEGLVDGGRVQRGDMLVDIDDRDYELAVKQQKAQVERAKLEVEVEKSAGDAAAREWEISGRPPPKDARRIALRAPQRELAEANVEAARAALDAAKLDLTRSKLRAPFNATVASESVEVGDVVAPGSVIARLVGTDRFLARVSLPVEDLIHLEVAKDGQPGSPVTLRQRLSRGAEIVRKGYVLRVVSELDPESRTAQVLIAVDNPLDPPEGAKPLYVGSFVEADIEGTEVADGVTIPGRAVFEGNRVWVVDDRDLLVLRELQIAFSRGEEMVVAEGLAAGDRVVTTAVPRAVAGMKVRLADPTVATNDAPEPTDG